MGDGCPFQPGPGRDLLSEAGLPRARVALEDHDRGGPILEGLEYGLENRPQLCFPPDQGYSTRPSFGITRGTGQPPLAFASDSVRQCFRLGIRLDTEIVLKASGVPVVDSQCAGPLPPDGGCQHGESYGAVGERIQGQRLDCRFLRCLAVAGCEP